MADPFRPPPQPWLPGNRGIEYAAEPGTPVRAIGAGTVAFAGQVAGRLVVVVAHAGDLRSSYLPFAAIAVGAGDRVRQGTVLGLAAGHLHLGVRRHGTYVDPASLWGGPGRLGLPWLVPDEPATLGTSGRGGYARPSARRPVGRAPQAALRPPTVATGTRPGGARRRAPPTVGEERSVTEPVVTMKQLLEARVHFGHQTRRWNPKMKRFIFGERNGIYIIDLQQTLERLETAYTFVRDSVADGGSVLFVGTKKQAQDPIQSYAEKCGMPYINERWLGGMLTNFETISKRVAKMAEYRRMRDSGEFEAMPKKEALLISRELAKLERNLGGIAQMEKLPTVVFILDTKEEHIAVTEANKLGIPIVAVVDTNCDPDIIQYVIPGNDDAIRSGALMCRVIADAVEEGRLIASKRPGAAQPPRARSAEEEAAVAAQQADARRQAAAAAAEREARIAAQQAAKAEADAAPAAETADAAPAEATETTEESTPDA
ncbi:MAG: 30S ribosomal protein S2 [Acidimicrobiales bacterium]